MKGDTKVKKQLNLKSLKQTIQTISTILSIEAFIITFLLFMYESSKIKEIVIFLLILLYCLIHMSQLKEDLRSTEYENQMILLNGEKYVIKHSVGLKFYSIKTVMFKALRNQSALLITVITAALYLKYINISDMKNKLLLITSVVIIFVVICHALWLCNHSKCVITFDTENYREQKIKQLLEESKL